MGLSEELEKIARLHDKGDLSQQELDQAKLRLLSTSSIKGVRRQSKHTLGGMPLWSVALGPDMDKGEIRGHAKGGFAVGDVATGVVAVGGMARGVVALGCLAFRLASFGGLGIGLVLALGGGAIGTLAFGGGAAGAIAIGGGAAGVYAMGGSAVGAHVLSATQCDADALDFFSTTFEWWQQLDILAQNCVS